MIYYRKFGTVRYWKKWSWMVSKLLMIKETVYKTEWPYSLLENYKSWYPHGSILGSLLFLSFFIFFSFYSFTRPVIRVDDSILFCSNKSIKALFQRAYLELEYFSDGSEQTNCPSMQRRLNMATRKHTIETLDSKN